MPAFLIFLTLSISLMGAIGYAYFVYIKPSHPTWVSVVVGVALVLVTNTFVTHVLQSIGTNPHIILFVPWGMFALWGCPMIGFQQYKHHMLKRKFDQTIKKLNGHAKSPNPFQEVEEVENETEE